MSATTSTVGPAHLSVGTFSHSSNSNNRVTNLTYNAKMHFGFKLSGMLLANITTVFLVTMGAIITHEIFPSIVGIDQRAYAIWLAPILGTAAVIAFLAWGFFGSKADECIDQIKQNPSLIKQLDASILEDKLFVVKSMNTNHNVYPYLPRKWQDDLDILLYRRECQLKELPNKVNADRTIEYLDAVKPRLAEFARKLPLSENIMKRGFEGARVHIELTFPEKLFDPSLEEEALNAVKAREKPPVNPMVIAKDPLLEIVENNPFVYSKLSVELRKDVDLAKAAVEGHHSLWLFVPEELSASIKQYYDQSVLKAFNP